jgi:signal transduction histidine kinase
MNFLAKIQVFFLLFLFQSVLSQNTYHTLWYSADSSHLPQNSVKSITPDKYGFIWISTEDGMVRYDGQSFKIFNTENVKDTHSNRMDLYGGSIEKDSILFVNEKGEIILINRRNAKKINRKTIHTPPVPPALFYSSTGNSFIIPSGQTTYAIGNDSIKMYHKQKLQQQFAYAYKDSSQFFSVSGNLYKAGANNSYVKFSGNSFLPLKFSQNFSNGYTIYINATAQQAFLHSGNKLFYLKEKNGLLETKLVFENFNLPENNIASVYYDEPNDVLYLGSSNTGLLKVKKQIFSHATHPFKSYPGNDGVYYALIDYNKTQAITSTGEIFSKKGYEGYIDIGRRTDKYMVTIDNNGDLWTKYGQNLYRFKKSSGFKSFDQWKFRNSITVIYKGSEGQIWVGMFNDINKKGGFLYQINPDAPNPQPKLFLKLDFAPASLNGIDNEVLWAGSWRGLYKIYLRQKKVIKIAGIPQTHVRSIFIKSPDEVWACTYDKGFFLFRDNRVTRFPIDKDQHLLTSHCIIEDNNGYFWITTNKGLFQVRKQDLYDFASHKIKKIYYHQYNKNAGFLNNEFNGGCMPCGTYLSNTTIFFPSMNGVVYFNPDSVKTRLPKSGIYIDEVSIDNKVFTASDSLIIDRKFERIKFFISSPHYGNPYNLNIEMKLEGPVEQDWIPMTENNISFSTLPPGNYTLKARKLTGFGSQWIYKSYHFSITPAFWQTTWFEAFIALAGALMLFFMVKLRIRYIRYKNILLENKVILQTSQLQETIVALRKTRDDLSRQITNHKNLIKTITHDIKSPLKFMAITGRFLYNNFEKQEPSMKEDIQAMYTSSSQLYHFVDSFLEYTKETDISNNEADSYPLHILVKEKIALFKNIASSKKTALVNAIPKDVNVTINKHLLSIIIHNLLDNAIKNTYGGSVSFDSSFINGSVMISVTDTGKGMTEEQVSYYTTFGKSYNDKEVKQNGMGLHIIAELLAITGGSMAIESSRDKGTKIMLLFKSAIV